MITPGTRIAHYDVLATIGAGGMGEVYRAKDTLLGREVALKVLPELFAADADRRARFQREAKTLAALNHPNIAAIHGLAEAPNVSALVLELVDGETLAERIDRGRFRSTRRLRSQPRSPRRSSPRTSGASSTVT